MFIKHYNVKIILLVVFLMLIHIPYSSHGTEIELSWDHNTQDELAGYYVYYGTSSRNYFDGPIKLPKESVVEIEGRVIYQFTIALTPGVTYFFAVTAYDIWGYETDFSNEDMYLSSEDGHDILPPTGSVLINSGDDITQTRNVTLTLSATDDGKELDGSALMSFSNDNQMWSVAESYNTAKIWNLSPGEGIKTVYVKFRDVAGNWMREAAQDQIRYGEDSQNTCDDSHKLKPVLVTASSAFLPPFFAKEKVIDGDPNTLWSTTPSLFMKSESITLDLGEIKKVSSVQMYASKTLFGKEFFPVNFGIQISHDNTAWEEISAEREYSLKPVLFGSWGFETIEVRYLRVAITKSKNFLMFYLVQIAEIEVYGCDLPENIPFIIDEHSLSEIDATQKHTQEGRETTLPDSDRLLPSTPGKPVIRFE